MTELKTLVNYAESTGATAMLNTIMKASTGNKKLDFFEILEIGEKFIKDLEKQHG